MKPLLPSPVADLAGVGWKQTHLAGLKVQTQPPGPLGPVWGAPGSWVGTGLSDTFQHLLHFPGS